MYTDLSGFFGHPDFRPAFRQFLEKPSVVSHCCQQPHSKIRRRDLIIELRFLVAIAASVVKKLTLRRLHERLDDLEHLALHHERYGLHQQRTSHEPGTKIVIVVVASSREKSRGPLWLHEE